MDELALAPLLKDLDIGPVRSFLRIGSTNDEAAHWIDDDAPDLALVFADEQTAGKGRLRRHWFTPAGAALAFSLILRLPEFEGSAAGINPTQAIPFDPSRMMMRMTGLGAVAVCEALQDQFTLQAQIKWPNDVLINRRKVAGILAEAHWHADRLEAVILGIGINIAPLSVPPDHTLIYPATSVQDALGHPIDRFVLLHAVLESLLRWRKRLNDPAFIHEWNERLAFKAEWVGLSRYDQGAENIISPVMILGLAEDGRLKVKNREEKEIELITGELSLRPADFDPN